MRTVLRSPPLHTGVVTKRAWLWLTFLLVLIAAGVLLVGCSGPDHGVVHAKDYSKAYSYPTSYCMVYRMSQSGMMTCTIYGTREVYVPASWTLDIYASKDDHGWVDVDQATYDRLKVGDYYSVKAQ
jgi:hypothetical protein